jgi:sarcosine oxidase subunit gamma
MAEVKLVPHSALGPLGLPRRIGRLSDAADVTLRERADIGFLSIAAERGEASAVQTRLSEVLGLGIPDNFRRVGDGVSAIGPGRWLLDGAFAVSGREEALRNLLAGIAGVVDESDGWVVLDLSGPRVVDALAKLVPIDLHPKSFRQGDLALTVAEHINIRLWRLSGGNSYRLAAPRSYAESLFRSLASAASEYGLEIA